MTSVYTSGHTQGEGVAITIAYDKLYKDIAKQWTTFFFSMVLRVFTSKI